MTEEEIQGVIDQLQWKFAKSMARIPHWYTVRQSDDVYLNELYEKLYNYIKENHYIGYFYKTPYKYCNIGEYKYWAMTDDITESIIINRTKLEGVKNGVDVQAN